MASKKNGQKNFFMKALTWFKKWGRGAVGKRAIFRARIGGGMGQNILKTQTIKLGSGGGIMRSRFSFLYFCVVDPYILY